MFLGLFKVRLNVMELINLGCLYGHSLRTWNPSLSMFVLGFRGTIVILDLKWSIFFFRRALSVLFHTAVCSKQVVFLYEHEAVRHAVSRTGQLYYYGPYKGGLVSNFFGLTVSGTIALTSNYAIQGNRFPSFVVNGGRDAYYQICHEALCSRVPCLSLIDSDLSYQELLFPIFGSDDSLPSRFYYVYVSALVAFQGLQFFRLFLRS